MRLSRGGAEPARNYIPHRSKHEIDRPEAKLITAVPSDWGWPRILSNLKSLLETGEPLALDQTPP
jgi:hypothetical protein